MIPLASPSSRPADLFLLASASKLTDDYIPRLTKAMAALPDEDLWRSENVVSNSVGNLLLHCEGNLRQWILSGVAGAEDRRERSAEFSFRGPLPKAELMDRLNRTVTECASAIRSLTAEDLSTRRTIQGYSVTALEAVYHAVEHFSYHLGQVLQRVKQVSGKDLRLYKF